MRERQLDATDYEKRFDHRIFIICYTTVIFLLTEVNVERVY